MHFNRPVYISTEQIIKSEIYYNKCADFVSFPLSVVHILIGTLKVMLAFSFEKYFYEYI